VCHLDAAANTAPACTLKNARTCCLVHSVRNTRVNSHSLQNSVECYSAGRTRVNSAQLSAASGLGTQLSNTVAHCHGQMGNRSSRLVLVCAPDSDAESHTTCNDDTLMALALGGDRLAFDALITRHQARMIRVAVRFLGDDAAAADAVQNTFVELFGALTRYCACGKFKAYLYRILINQCRALRRRGRVESNALSIMSMYETRTVDQALDSDRQRQVERGLSQLTPKHRAVLVLRYSADLTYQEIAESLAIPVGTVKSRIAEGMARLREVLMEEKPGPLTIYGLFTRRALYVLELESLLQSTSGILDLSAVGDASLQIVHVEVLP
jgi:RNA polymerase sigma-70 factor (ECF subfamily)